MIVEILTKLSAYMNMSPWLALWGAFLWGVASVLLSPCHLGSIPLVMGFVGANKEKSVKSALFKSSIFSLGILLVMLFIGLITSYLGRMLGDLGNLTNVLGILLFLGVSLLLSDIIQIPQLNIQNFSYFKKGSYISILILGLLFGTVLGPCAFAFLMPVLGIVFEHSKENPIYSYSLLLAYAIGHSLLIVLAGTVSGWVQSFSNINQKYKFIVFFRKLLALLCLIVAISFFFNF